MSIELKIRSLTCEEIACKTSGRLVQASSHNRPVRYVSTDSRDVGEDILFFAIRGERFDGHAFAAAAVRGGATCLVCSEMPKDVSTLDCTVILVEDTIKALGALAAYYRTLAQVRVVAVTGSVGKTTTKELIHHVLSESMQTHKTVGNFNNHIGLPLTIFALSSEDRVAVLEMGMSARREISYLSRIAQPDVAVITNVGTSHLEHLGTRENIAEAKMEIMDGLAKDGLLVINGDEPLLAKAKERFPHVKTVSRKEIGADLSAMEEKTGETELSYQLRTEDGTMTQVKLSVPGAHNVYNSMIAYAVGRAFGMEDEAILRGLTRFTGVAMRQNIFMWNNIKIIEDCYNASPESMRAALDVLLRMERSEGGRHTALLGDMLELGVNSASYHESVGRYAAEHGLERLFAYGERAEDLVRGARLGGMADSAIHVWKDKSDPAAMAKILKEVLIENDILLVKASRGVAAEKVLACLCGDDRQ